MYAVVIVFILGIFLLDKLSDWCIFQDGTGVFQRLVLMPTDCLFVKCSSSVKHKDSYNLYADITPEALQKEYEDTAELFRLKTVELTSKTA